MGKIIYAAGFVFKLILLTIIAITCFCTVYGMWEYSLYPFAYYPKPLIFLLCLTVMIMFAPLVYLVYKVKKFDKESYNNAFICFASLDCLILCLIFANFTFD